MRPAGQALVKQNRKESKDFLICHENPTNAGGVQEVLRFRFDTYFPKIQQAISQKSITK
jgi:hypothetical protein